MKKTAFAFSLILLFACCQSDYDQTTLGPDTCLSDTTYQLNKNDNNQRNYFFENLIIDTAGHYYYGTLKKPGTKTVIHVSFIEHPDQNELTKLLSNRFKKLYSSTKNKDTLKLLGKNNHHVASYSIAQSKSRNLLVLDFIDDSTSVNDFYYNQKIITSCD